MCPPTAQRQTVQTNEFVLIRQFLHKIATASVRTGFAMTRNATPFVIARLAEQDVAIHTVKTNGFVPFR